MEKAAVDEEESEKGASIASEEHNEVLNNSLVKNLEKEIDNIGLQTENECLTRRIDEQEKQLADVWKIIGRLN